MDSIGDRLGCRGASGEAAAVGVRRGRRRVGCHCVDREWVLVYCDECRRTATTVRFVISLPIRAPRTCVLGVCTHVCACARMRVGSGLCVCVCLLMSTFSFFSWSACWRTNATHHAKPLKAHGSVQRHGCSSDSAGKGGSRCQWVG